MKKTIGGGSNLIYCFNLFFVFVNLLVFLNTTFASPTDHHSCRPDQKNALLEFIHEFQVFKLIPWKQSRDCCSWDGVTCDVDFGFVIGLDLSFGPLYGTFKPNSSLFKLNHLQNLNLSGNNFTESSIPSELGKLTRLTSLNLSYSGFSGQIPNELLQLTGLVSLDLATLAFGDLFTETSFLSTLARNLTNLRELRLVHTNISSIVPNDFVNISSLRSLILCRCNLLGEFPSDVFFLPHIESVNVSGNRNLRGHLPEFPSNSPLRHLVLSNNSFSGNLPDAIGNLMSLEYLDLSRNKFVGKIPSSIHNLNHLTGLALSHNKFTGSFPLGSLNLAKLRIIFLSDNDQLTVSLPSDIDSGLNVSNANSSLTSYLPSPLERLGLSACNIAEIPSFLRTQRSLLALDLSSNKMRGQVPQWLWKLPELLYLNLSHNSFSHLEGSPKFLSARSLQTLDLSSNAFQGPLPRPPMSTKFLLVSANNFSGEIPLALCKLNTLEILDLSNNSFSGLIPQCLGNARNSVSVVSLRNNNLIGSLPDRFIRCKSLQTLDVGHNKLAGRLPRSLLNCKNLQVLNVERNRISDKFPFWLEDLQELQVLILRSNSFHGQIISSTFSKLQIIDISHNNFFGTLPSDCFANWSTMSSVKTNEDSSPLWYVENNNPDYYADSMVLTIKGREMMYERILTIFKAVDFSGNKFRGQIPESVGLFKELIVLNFSNNIFTGRIPRSLANLTELESLDLSQNKLSGKIPPELGDNTRLGHINFSHNQLTSTIPQSPQFITQGSSSFEGNLGLCGRPLEQTCGANTSPARPNQQPESKEEALSWIAIVIGYIPGLVFGLTIGHIVASYKHERILKIFGVNRRRRIRTR